MTSKSKTAKTLAVKNAAKPNKAKEAAKKTVAANTAAKKVLKAPTKAEMNTIITKQIKQQVAAVKKPAAKTTAAILSVGKALVVKPATKPVTKLDKKVSKVEKSLVKTAKAEVKKSVTIPAVKVAKPQAKPTSKPAVKKQVAKPVVKKVAALEKKPEVKKQPVSSTSNIIQAFANATTPQVDKNSGKLVLSPVSDKKIEPMTKVLAQVKKPETGKVTMQELFGKQPTAVPAAKTFPFLK